MADFANATIEWGPTPDTITLLQLLKDQLGIADNARDAELSMYLDLAGDACEKYIDNIIDQRDVTENIAISKHPIPLRYYPVSALTLITVDGEDVTANYELFQDEGLSWSVKDRAGGAISDQFDQLTLTYTAGYDPLPSALGYAVMLTGASYESGTGVAAGEIRKESVVGVGSIEYTTSVDAENSQSRYGLIPSAATSVLEQYKRLWA